jgi:hypothetical protein
MNHVIDYTDVIDKLITALGQEMAPGVHFTNQPYPTPANTRIALF